jgi:Tol biopolymer transport system component
MKITRVITVAVVAFAVAATNFGPGVREASAAVGPNGLIAYSSWDDNLNYDIYVVDPVRPDQAPTRLTTDGAYNGNPDWSPDGMHIAFDGWGEFGGPRIQVMDANPSTDDAHAISDPCALSFDCYGDFQPAWSPTGTQIAFVSSRPNADGTPNWSYEIYVMDALGEVGELAPATRLTSDIPDEDTGKSIDDSQVTWSPDGSRLAFVSRGRGLDEDSCDLWVMDSVDRDGDGVGDNLRQLTTDDSFNCDPFEDITPQWSPNSNLIAFTSVRTGYFDIWVVNANDPTDLRNVTQTPDGYEDQPSWSPDGTQIIFRSDASGQYEMYSLPVPPPVQGAAFAAPSSAEVAGSPNPTQLTHDGKTKQQADWGAKAGALRSTATLTVAMQGKGHVTAKGIDCRSDCAATYVVGKKVRLTAQPAAGQRFKKWTGACAGKLLTCTVKLSNSKSVTAVFVARR